MKFSKSYLTNKTKTTIRNKLDKLVSQIVRARGSCERCGKTSNLQCAHIFGRRYSSTRWYLGNLLCLCPNCHINFSHQQPVLFTEWVKKHLGNKNYELLKATATPTSDWTIEDLQGMFKDLTESKSNEVTL